MKADKADSAAVGEANDSTVSPVANTAAAVKEKHTEKRPVFATVLTQKQTMDAKGKPIVVYGIKVTSNGGTYAIQKRFSQFDTFNKAVKQHSPAIPFPGTVSRLVTSCDQKTNSFSPVSFARLF
jgi:chemotaxis response regulator CheB